MGAWGVGNFENDDALDWVIDLESAKDMKIIQSAFEAVIQSAEDYVDAWEASVALAAAEVVSALLRTPHPKLPDDVVAWVSQQHGKSLVVEKLIIEQALRALSIIAAESELQELWEETDEFDLWRAEVNALIARLDRNASH
jgi:hypothetical protein